LNSGFHPRRGWPIRSVKIPEEMIYEQLAISHLARSKKQAKCTEIILDQVATYEESGLTDAQTVFSAALHINMLSHDVMALLLLHCGRRFESRMIWAV
jgi:hypothetical protein